MLTLEQIDHALEWHLRRLVTRAGYWPDVEQLLAAEATPEDLEREKQRIKGAGRELIEVFGVAPWAERGVGKGNNLYVSRLTTSRGSYGIAEPISYDPVDPDDLSQGYTLMELPDSPQNVRYEVRYTADDSTMDRRISELVLQAFGTRRYLYGMQDDLSKADEGFWVVPVGDSQDVSGEDYTERLWRIEVQDVQLIPALPVEHVPAALSLGLDLSIRDEDVASADFTPET